MPFGDGAELRFLRIAVPARLSSDTRNKVYRNWFVLDMQWDRAQVKFPLEHKTVEIDHLAREYEVRSGVRGGLTVWDPEDSDCAKTALRFSLSNLARQGEDTIAGFRSIRYTGLRSKQERIKLWLSPSLGCTQMRVLTLAHNSIGLPTSYSRLELVLVEIGEPDRILFEAPNEQKDPVAADSPLVNDVSSQDSPQQSAAAIQVAVMDPSS